MSVVRPFGWVVLLLLAIPAPAVAQESSPAMDSLREAYRRLDFPQVIRLGQRVVDDYSEYSTSDLVEAHTLLALVSYTESDPEAARVQFEAALTLDPDLSLDPVLVSPKILAFLDEVRAAGRWRAAGVGRETVRYVMLQDPALQATLRSAVLPGWGQLYKRQPVKGGFMLTMWTVGAAGSLGTFRAARTARQKYRDAASPGRENELYNDYKLVRSWNRAFLLLAGSVWAGSYLDALLSPTKAPAGGGEWELVPQVDEAQLGFAARLTF